MKSKLLSLIAATCAAFADHAHARLFGYMARAGLVAQLGENGNVPTRQQLNRYSVNRPGWEAVRQTLYDFQAYAAAGQTQLTFFALPLGQGGKTLSDTNMTLAGQLPKNQEFLIQSIEIFFSPTVPAVAASNPSSFGAPAVAALLNDAYIVGRTGNLQLTIGSKPYLTEAPLGRFPQKAHYQVMGAASDSTTAAAAQNGRHVFGFWTGRPYLLSPADLLLPENQNFSVVTAWPEGAQAIVNPARIGVILDGILYRRSQ